VTRSLAAAALIALLACVAPARAERVRHVLRTAPALVGLPGVASERYQNAADLILEQGVRNLPLFPAASSAYTWRWNPDTHAYERTSDEVTPFYLTERGETLGEGLLNASVTFGYFDVGCSSGCRIGTDRRPLSVSAAAIRYQAPTDLLYTVSTFNFTYGVTDDLDVNVAIPIATLDMSLDVTRQDNPSAPLRSASRNVEAANVSDTMVRAKYRVFTTAGPLGSTAGAAGVRVRIPTGDPSRGLGPAMARSGRTSPSRRTCSRVGSTPTSTAAWTRGSAICVAARLTTPGRSTCTRRAATSGGGASRSPGASSAAASSSGSARRRRSRART